MPDKLDQIFLVDELDQIIQNHVNGYEFKGGRVIGREWYLDPMKKKIVIRLYVERGANEELSTSGTDGKKEGSEVQQSDAGGQNSGGDFRSDPSGRGSNRN